VWSANAEQRATRVNEKKVPFARVADIYAALPAITGKLELEYEGELKGADIIRPRVDFAQQSAASFSKHFPEVNFQPGHPVVRARW